MKMTMTILFGICFSTGQWRDASEAQARKLSLDYVDPAPRSGVQKAPARGEDLPHEIARHIAVLHRRRGGAGRM